MDDLESALERYTELKGLNLKLRAESTHTFDVRKVIEVLDGNILLIDLPLPPSFTIGSPKITDFSFFVERSY